MMVGLFCIAITRGEFRVSAVSGMDLFVIVFIGRKQLDIVIGSSVLGVVGIRQFRLSPLYSKTYGCLEFMS